MRRTIRIFAALGLAWPAAALSQERNLSLADALRLAESRSEAVRIAEAGVQRARGQVTQARSQYLPQLNGSLTYTRTLASQFEVFESSGPPTPPPGTPPVPPDDGSTYYAPCTRYLAPAGATEAERVAGLETFARCSSGTGGFPFDFSQAGFGAENQYQFGLSGSVNLFTGGRAQAQNRAADAGRRAADIELASQRAQMALDVTSAYFDAILADRLVAIAESSLAQTENVLGQTRLARQVGNQSEFELLRAQVTRDNQMPQLLQRRTDRELAYLRLKQLLNLPFGDSVRLTTALEDERELLAVSRSAGVPATITVDDTDTAATQRAPVRQLAENLRAQQEQLRVARREWVPTVSLSSDYGRVAFPSSGVPDWSNLLTNWTVSVRASFPLFTGGRIRGASMVAEANVREAQARLEQTREAAAFDARQASAQLAQAEAALAASEGTAEQATRAYAIADVRFREGLSTQIELNDSRLLLQQASANRAQAVRNLQVARMRLALLRDLPLGAGGATISPAQGGGTVAPGFIAPQGATTAPNAPRAAAGGNGNGQR